MFVVLCGCVGRGVVVLAVVAIGSKEVEVEVASELVEDCMRELQ